MEKQGSEAQKNWKTNVWNFDFSENSKIIFLIGVCAIEDKHFFYLQRKDA